MSEDLLQQISGRFDVEEVVSKANNNPEIFKFHANNLCRQSFLFQKSLLQNT